MAERRMFAKSVINSARFLRMPQASRLLYYDLGMAADDEGVVEAFTVIRLTGATEDDLNVLVKKGFVTILNDDLVTFIHDWKRNNYIQKDRRSPSIYRELLVKILDVSKLDTDCIHNVSGLDTQDRLGKDSIGEDRLGKGSTGKERQGEERAGEAEGPPPPPPPGRAEAYFREMITPKPPASSMERLRAFEGNMGTDVCIRAIDEAVNAEKKSWNYVNAILMDKQAKGVRSLEDWDRVEAGYQEGKKHPGNPFLRIAAEEGVLQDLQALHDKFEAEEEIVSVQDDPPPS